jgi:hypothetical protein
MNATSVYGGSVPLAANVPAPVESTLGVVEFVLLTEWV